LVRLPPANYYYPEVLHEAIKPLIALYRSHREHAPTTLCLRWCQVLASNEIVPVVRVCGG